MRGNIMKKLVLFMVAHEAVIKRLVLSAMAGMAVACVVFVGVHLVAQAMMQGLGRAVSLPFESILRGAGAR